MFTKGPWRVEQGHYPSFIDVKSDGALNLSMCWYATDLTEAQGEETRANANLISAAPDMYQALESILYAFWLACEDLPDEFEKRNEVKDARSALSKARGEA